MPAEWSLNLGNRARNDPGGTAGRPASHARGPAFAWLGSTGLGSPCVESQGKRQRTGDLQLLDSQKHLRTVWREGKQVDIASMVTEPQGPGPGQGLGKIKGIQRNRMRPSEVAEVTLPHPAGISRQKRKSSSHPGLPESHHTGESFVFISKLQGPLAVPASDPDSKPQGTLGQPDTEEPQL